MGYQLVVSGNRILAHGTDCFYSMGGTVICPDSERVYQNATIVNCNTIPADIDTVGYEYRSGDFVPCAPFGVGDGNVAVVCGDDCKAIKDSGLPLSKLQTTALLWENDDPAKKFIGQNIELASAEYDILMVVCNDTTFYLPKDSEYTVTKTVVGVESAIMFTNYYTRTFISEASTVTVYNCYSYYVRIQQSGAGVDEAEANDALKPLKIYGIKLDYN